MQCTSTKQQTFSCRWSYITAFSWSRLFFPKKESILIWCNNLDNLRYQMNSVIQCNFHTQWNLATQITLHQLMNSVKQKIFQMHLISPVQRNLLIPIIFHHLNNSLTQIISQNQMNSIIQNNWVLLIIFSSFIIFSISFLSNESFVFINSCLFNLIWWLFSFHISKEFNYKQFNLPTWKLKRWIIKSI